MIIKKDYSLCENLNNIPGLTAAVKADLDSIQAKGMLETVKSIL